ncbi:MAG TPA: valine--tRNA ligase [Dehalococcoidia bacterium]|nr:valine--tRNA ligase [Dehalococcoidia bacterium]
MTQAKSEMPAAYEPVGIEAKWYQFWLEKGYFTPKIDPKKEPFVIIMPPPNVTGELHMGHAITAALEDIMVRWHRMMGEPTLWLPGVDHAAIAAQVVVEKQLAEEGINRQQLGREKFLEYMQVWVDQCHSRITEQHKRLGISCDWSREKYTMDPGPSKAVRTTFKRLYEKGLIYRGERISNWCPRCATALSDLEVDHKDINGHLWHVNYPVVGEAEKFITVATTRPETIVGDTAVAVNPEDKRFKNLIGKKVLLPAVEREIPIVADAAVSMEFGTGAVKITPAHDPVDFDVAQRQGLPMVNILNNDVTMNENAGPYRGMDRFDARKAIIADLEASGQMVRVEPYSHSVGHCQRCQTVVEPVASLQWYVRIEPLALPAIAAVKDGRINILPERFTKVYLNWMENIRDWCISRQLWWGHRIPVWYCAHCGEVLVEVETPKKCPKCTSAKLQQDPDTLDTWFSSALWPHSTLGWPEETDDLRYFYPTSVMETAYDILFFWVARMIMMGLENTGQIPFHTVYLHGLIRDDRGEKMSKTRGNVVDPLIMMEEYGTDALRLALTTGTSPGADSRLSTEKMEAGRNFANKLWNATRFVLRSAGSYKGDMKVELPLEAMEDRWILSRLNDTIADVERLMKDFQFGEAQRQIHDFLWGEFCDWYIEISKVRIGNPEVVSPVPVLVHVLEKSSRLLHPYMPFITEELWQNIKEKAPVSGQTADSIMIAGYPQVDKSAIDPEAERVMMAVMGIIRAIRNARAENYVEANRIIDVRIYTTELKTAIAAHTQAIRTLARADVTFIDKKEDRADENILVTVLSEAEVVIPMVDILDIEAEKKRLSQEMEQTRADVERLEAMLKNKEFLSKAPVVVVDKERARLESRRDNLKRLAEHLDRLKS